MAGDPPGLLSRVLSGSLVQSCPDPAVYGVVQSGDHMGRTCVVKWFKLRPSGDDVEVSVQPCFLLGGLGGRALGSRQPILCPADWRGGRRERL